MRILDVFNVAHSFTEFALGNVVCLTFAAWNVLNLVKFEINLLVTSFVTVGTLCGEIPVFFRREVNLSQVFHVAGNLQIESDHLRILILINNVGRRNVYSN